MKEEPIVVTEPKESVVPTINKKEIEWIAKSAVTRGVDLEHLSDYDFVELRWYNGEDILQIAELDNVLFITNEAIDISESLAAYKKIKQNIIKAIKDGVIKHNGAFSFINFVNATDINFVTETLVACFGHAMGNSDSGEHIEVGLRTEHYWGEFSEI